MSISKSVITFGLLAAALLTAGPAHARGNKLEAAQQAVLEHPMDPGAWTRLGRQMERAGRPGDAASAYQMANQLQGGLGGAETSALEAAVLREPENDEAWGDLGDALVASGHPDRAREAYLLALSIDPTDGEWWRALAGLLSADEVEDLLARMGGQGENGDELVGAIAKGLREQGRDQEALSWFIRALRMDTGDSEWATAITELGGPQTLIDVLKEVAESAQNDEVFGDMGDAYWELQLAQQACASWERAASMDPGDDEWRNKLRGRCGTGEATVLAQQGVESIEDVLRAVQGGRPLGELAPVVRQLLDGEPTRQELRWLVASNEGKSEVELLQELAGAHADSDEVYGDLGDALYAAGRVDEAIDAWKKAFSLDSSDSEWTRKLWIAASLNGRTDALIGIPVEPSGGAPEGVMGIRGIEGSMMGE
ncbi:MAG: tetratricopeptide repeat protein [Deltaproteobacteria bacterium]|nr:tetratricopeptide repeat protein [Deltaproteobacteria bacterium]